MILEKLNSQIYVRILSIVIHLFIIAAVLLSIESAAEIIKGERVAGNSILIALEAFWIYFYYRSIVYLKKRASRRERPLKTKRQ